MLLEIEHIGEVIHAQKAEIPGEVKRGEILKETPKEHLRQLPTHQYFEVTPVSPRFIAPRRRVFYSPEEGRFIIEVSSEIPSLVQESIELFSKNQTMINGMRKMAEKLYYGTEPTPGEIGGYVKTLPGYIDFIKQCKGDWKKSYFLAIIAFLSHTAWNEFHQKGRKEDWNLWENQMREIWNAKSIDTLLTRVSQYVGLPVIITTPPSTPPTPSVPAKPEEFKILGMSPIQLILLSIIGVGSLFVIRRLLK